MSRGSGSSGVLPLQVREVTLSSTFIPVSKTLISARFFVEGTNFCAFLGMNCLFGLSVLVYVQSHAFLCSGQLQTFPVYSFLWNLVHSCDYKI